MTSQRCGILTSQSQKESPITYFQTVLKEAGIQLSQDERPNILTKEQSLISRDLEKMLKEHEAYPRNLNQFLSGFRKFYKNEDYFKKAFANSVLKKDDSESEHHPGFQQESLIRIFLHISEIQVGVIETVFDQITIQAAEENSENWLRLLLNPLRYLSHINDAQTLTSKLLDILDIATYPSQLEILNAIPEILPDSQYEQVASQLTRILESNSDLTAAILDCLNSLSLNSEVMTDVQSYITNNLLTSSSRIFPILFEFLVGNCKNENLCGILLKCRNVIDTILSADPANKENEALKVIIVSKLYTCAAIPKAVFEGWIKIISDIKVDTDHKSTDLLILIILHATGTARKKVVESLIKKKLRAGLFKTSLLENLFQKYLCHQYLYDYMNSFNEIGINLLRHYNDIKMVEFGSILMKQLFSHHLTNDIRRQDILHNLILLAGSSDNKTVSNVLDLLKQMSEHPKLQQHALQLMSLLEKLETYELHDVRQIFDLLCGLVCNSDDLSGLKDEIHILVRKQLSSTRKQIKMRGIISAITMVKHIAYTSEEQNDISMSDESICNISDLPKGAPQEAASLLEMTYTCCSRNSELLALYYDQLAYMILSSVNSDKYFMCWLFESITNDFQDKFVTESCLESIEEINLSSQFSLNSSQEIDVSININIAELTIKRSTGTNDILTLSPLFRLLRLIHYQHQNGDLDSIDALLGCGVLLPTVDDLNLFESHQIKNVADCLFHCINWFREVVSAFVTQKSKKLREKVIKRIEHLVILEKLLTECMAYIPEHQLPASYFYNLNNSLSPKKSEKLARPKKKLKSKAIVTDLDSTIPCTSTNAPAVKASKKSNSKSMEKNFDFQFREMDIDVIVLLKYPLSIEDASTENQTYLNMKQFQFLIKDFVLKLSLLLKNKNLGLSNLKVVDPISLITDCSRLLPCIKKHLNLIKNKIGKLLEETDHRHDLPELFTEEAVNLKISLNLIMQTFALLFGWPGFQNTKNVNLLRECLKNIRGEEPSQLTSANRLIIEFVDKMNTYVDFCLYLPTAVSLIQIMQSLYAINQSPEIQKKTIYSCEKLLTKKWYNLSGNADSGKEYTANIELLTTAYLKGANLKTICGLVATIQTQAAELQDKEDYLLVLPSIDKSTFYILYRSVCFALLEQVKSEITSLTNSQHLVLWKTIALTLQGLMAIVKIHENRQNLISFLKNALGVLKIFLNQGIPILEIMLRSKTDHVIEIFKTMQTSTRFLHHLCCQSKLTKDTSLVTYVPQFRLTLETLVYRVKAALVANDCSAAFWMGNLRNKDLHGEDIASQTSTISNDRSEVNSDEEIPPDDKSDEDENADPDEGNDSDTTVSDIF